MITLQSAVICDMVQELENGDLNYIGVFNSAVTAGEALGFDFATSWFGDSGDYLQEIKIISPSGKLLDESDHNFTIEEYHHIVITEFGIDISEIGTYYIEVYMDNLLVNQIPLIIEPEN